MSRWSDVIQSAAPLPDYMIIEGSRISANNRDVIDVNDPGSGLKLCDVPAGTVDDVAAAVDAARKALTGPWARISPRQLQNVVGYVDRAKSRGLSFVTGGDTVTVEGCEGGNFFAPTIADNVAPEDELAQEEIFGPVLCITPVEDVEHAIEIANGTDYGLAAGIHTSNISSALRFARGVSAGQISINGYNSAGETVASGGMKQSGIGREKGLAALANYVEKKAIAITL